jgi:hypothetical protein
LEARQFFQIKQSYHDYAPVTTSPDISGAAHSIVHSDVHLTNELPSCLQALIAPSQPPSIHHQIPPHPPHVSSHLGSTHSSAGPTRGTRQQPRRNDRPSPAGSNTGPPSTQRSPPLVNPHATQALVALFSDLQLSDQVRPAAKRTLSLLQEANLSMEQAQALLGLHPMDCFNYHARGTCSRQHCPLQHIPHPPLPDSTVTALMTQLQPAVERIKSKRRRGPQS